MSAGAVLGRLADGIGFRFRRASEGIREADLGFRPAADCMSLAELMEHILDLPTWVGQSVGVQLPKAVNGPLSDWLTHIGQMLSWRRIARAPAAQADVFRGTPPRG